MTTQKINNQKARPFLKWVGGKTQLLNQYEEYIPEKFGHYYEPMVGGGALFFHLISKNNNLKATIIDVNKELINTYNEIKSNTVELIRELKKLDKAYKTNPKEFYYSIREWDRLGSFKNKSNVERASRTIFLNKTCFNGLYRVNKTEQFNTPIGRYKNPTVCDEENLYSVSKILKNTTILNKDFETVLKLAKPNDFIYFDPPYYPINTTSFFTSYNGDGFIQKEQERLFNTFKKLDKMGCKVMLSNSDTEFISKLYSKYNIKKISAKRYINSKGNKRGNIYELLIMNY